MSKEENYKKTRGNRELTRNPVSELNVDSEIRRKKNKHRRPQMCYKKLPPAPHGVIYPGQGSIFQVKAPQKKRDHSVSAEVYMERPEIDHKNRIATFSDGSEYNILLTGSFSSVAKKEWKNKKEMKEYRRNRMKENNLKKVA